MFLLCLFAGIARSFGQPPVFVSVRLLGALVSFSLSFVGWLTLFSPASSRASIYLSGVPISVQACRKQYRPADKEEEAKIK